MFGRICDLYSITRLGCFTLALFWVTTDHGIFDCCFFHSFDVMAETQMTADMDTEQFGMHLYIDFSSAQLHHVRISIRIWTYGSQTANPNHHTILLRAIMTTVECQELGSFPLLK